MENWRWRRGGFLRSSQIYPDRSDKWMLRRVSGNFPGLELTSCPAGINWNLRKIKKSFILTEREKLSDVPSDSFDKFAVVVL